jgi:large subunit ribosomal protein L32
MAVPKRRKSHSRVRTARANKGLSKPKVVYCSNCGAAALPHRICPNCGQYQGRVVVDTEEK